jgi:hypothetical protein
MRGSLMGVSCIAFVLAACGAQEAPVLSEFTFVGQAQESPSVLLFTVDFQDSDGDLGDGATQFLLNGEQTDLEPLSNQAVFLANELPLDARQGTLEFVVELAFDDESLAAEQEEFEFSVKMNDAAGYDSNAVHVTLLLSLNED